MHKPIGFFLTCSSDVLIVSHPLNPSHGLQRREIKGHADYDRQMHCNTCLPRYLTTFLTEIGA